MTSGLIEDDAALPEPAGGAAPTDCVLFGDSITRDWPPELLAGDVRWINRGVAGETTGQMRLRFARDGLAPRPVVLHFLGGINDIAGNQGFVPIVTIAENIAAMVGAARRAGLGVILGLVMPCTIVRKRPHLVPQPAILALNTALRGIAAEHGAVLADYFEPLVDAAGRLRADCTQDGLHLNAAGYAAVAPVRRAALARLRDG